MNVRRVPHRPTVTQTEHQDGVAIQICLLVYGAMDTMFLTGKTWDGQLISPWDPCTDTYFAYVVTQWQAS